ncbi:hypothetical protein M422DRAFT_197585 [Sphaerobolus stellatus SS14]|nr:hypothetical protein M422DRAFT_197585 [Sphaerobolus stellatus SS14]
MPTLPKFIRRNSSQRTIVGDVHDKIHHGSDKKRAAVDQGTHEFKPPGDGDFRSVCPALNALANHSYLPHDGKNLSFSVLSHALQKGYGVSALFADFLVLGGFILLRRSVLSKLDLDLINHHNRIEHNASIVHDDDDNGAKDAPTKVDPILLHKFVTKAYSPQSLINSEGKNVITIEDIAQTRVAREADSSPVDPLHAEIARGEFAMVLDIFGKGQMKTLDADEIQTWLKENRFPDGWAPSHTEHLLDTIRESKKMRALMQQYRGEEPKNLFVQLEQLVAGHGHGVITALWRVIETLVLKLRSKDEFKAARASVSQPKEKTITVSAPTPARVEPAIQTVAV